MCNWNRGHHPYFGKLNGRGMRQRSKLYKGIKINFKKLAMAFEIIEKDGFNKLQTAEKNKNN